MPCSQCASIIIQSGIHRVVTVPSESERWAESFRYTEELFREAGVELVMRSTEPQS
jgi:dCMP deaminase